MSGMRFKGLVGAMDVAAALDSLARGVAEGVIRHAPFGGEAAPLVFSQTAHLAFKVSAHKGRAKIALKLRTGPRAERDAGHGDERRVFPFLAMRAAGIDAGVPSAPDAPLAKQDETHRLKLKAKGNAPVREAAALIHGLAAGLAAGNLLLRMEDEEIALAPGPVLKLSLKGKDASLGVKISWKPGMEDTAEPLPQLFTEPETATAVPAPGARTDRKTPDHASPAPRPATDAAPVARCCAAPVSAATAPADAVPAAVPADAVPADAPAAASPQAARAVASATISGTMSGTISATAPASPDSSSPRSTPGCDADSPGPSGGHALATGSVLPPEAGIPAQEAVAAIVAAVGAVAAMDDEQRPTPPARKAAKAPAKAPATPKAKASAKAAAARPAKQPRPAAAPAAQKTRPAKARKP